MSAQLESEQPGRPDHVRSSNDRIAQRAVEHRFVSRVPMLCECSDAACEAIFLIELDRYRDLRRSGYLTAPEHAVAHAAPTAREHGYWLQRPTRG